MKPISSAARKGRKLPLVEFNYQPMRLSRFHAGCGKSVPPAFHSISRNYFQREARRDFVGELGLFVVITLTAAAPFFSTASALTELCRAIGQL